ncbi:MAG: cytochrome b/b6 domain-containing protein [Pseudomonadales bacterium]|jgi:cytochrome b|nr:cytochrome b/b6 domain-containing protein [Pseudomonadales bacterium]
MMEQTGDRGTPVWDLPLRLFHWLLAGAIAVSLYTGISGGFEEMDWHQRSGYLVLGLVLFRLLWGFVGGRHARFASFLAGPGRVLAYGRAMAARRPPRTTGHNPLAGWTISLTLLAIAVQAATGLFASDDLFVEGPLVHLVESGTVSTMTRIHGWGQWTVGALVALHLLAVAVHSEVFNERIIGPMITGRSGDAPAAEGDGEQRLALALGIATVVAALVWWVVTKL